LFQNSEYLLMSLAMVICERHNNIVIIM